MTPRTASTYSIRYRSTRIASAYCDSTRLNHTRLRVVARAYNVLTCADNAQSAHLRGHTRTTHYQHRPAVAPHTASVPRISHYAHRQIHTLYPGILYHATQQQHRTTAAKKNTGWCLFLNAYRAMSLRSVLAVIASQKTLIPPLTTGIAAFSVV
eukprot:3077023-Rhodomonas_salina.3